MFFSLDVFSFVKASIIKHDDSETFGIGSFGQPVEKRLDLTSITATLQVAVNEFVGSNVQCTYKIEPSG